MVSLRHGPLQTSAQNGMTELTTWDAFFPKICEGSIVYFQQAVILLFSPYLNWMLSFINLY